MIRTKLWIYKDRSGLLARPWHVQGETGCTLGSFRSWRLACDYACLTVGAWRA